jgi:hypothetical protein
MSKGLCCAAQKNGDLGKPLIVTVHRKDGTTTTRCGTCEIGPSCANPQKLAFKFRFLKGVDCNLAGGSCVPTAAGVAQYQAEAARVRVSGDVPDIYQYPLSPGGGPIVFSPRPPAGAPYVLPNS